MANTFYSSAGLSISKLSSTTPAAGVNTFYSSAGLEPEALNAGTTGTITNTAAPATQSATGGSANRGTITNTTASATQAATGGSANRGTITNTTAPATQTATGSVDVVTRGKRLVFNPFTGTFDWVQNLDGYLPYVGASANVNLNSKNLKTTGTITAGAFVGPITGNVTGNVTGDLTGDVTGDVTGNLTGNVTGDLTGDVIGGTISVTAYERHVQIPAVVTGNPATAPAPVTFETVGGLQFSSVLNNSAFCQWEIPNDWNGTDIYFEVGWFPDSGAMSGTDTVEWVIDYRSVAEGELVNAGTVQTKTITNSDDNAQYKTIHSRATLDFDDANQPLAKQDHVFFKVTRNTGVANDFAGTVTVPAFEINYMSVGLPTN